MIIPPAWKKSPPIDSLIPSLIVGFLPPVQTSLEMSFEESSFEESSDRITGV